jgi:malate synthase
VPIHNLMEDAATAEIARAQLWQWVHLAAVMADGHAASPELYKLLRDDEVRRLSGDGRIPQAAALLDELVLSKDFAEFLTLPAYDHL